MFKLYTFPEFKLKLYQTFVDQQIPGDSATRARCSNATTTLQDKQVCRVRKGLASGKTDEECKGLVLPKAREGYRQGPVGTR